MAYAGGYDGFPPVEKKGVSAMTHYNTIKVQLARNPTAKIGAPKLRM